ncbi:MAG: PhoH-like protein [bacterium ADurb.Bin363]|nr:MAG: PhoH-like protein [bacterium ADurb.Bin363]
MEEFQLQLKLNLGDNNQTFRFLGLQNENLKIIESHTPVKIISRGNDIILSGEKEEVDKTAKLFSKLKEIFEVNKDITTYELRYAVEQFNKNPESDLTSFFSNIIFVTPGGRQIKPKTASQSKYITSIRKHDVVFSIGPAGTGKTYLAVAMAIVYLKNREVSRIVLTRPAVEAGERLGFLPGDLQEKVDPYLRPLYDALYDMMDIEKFQKLKEKGIIEIAPLAFMRGRSLNSSFIILDEAQNTSSEQMKMFLTRLGYGSKAVITGDITQMDLPVGIRSGLVEAQYVLNSIEGISFCYFNEQDVVRHELVKKIIKAYENKDKLYSEHKENQRKAF